MFKCYWLLYTPRFVRAVVVSLLQAGLVAVVVRGMLDAILSDDAVNTLQEAFWGGGGVDQQGSAS